MQCSIMFDCLRVRLFSISKSFGWVRLSSIKEPSRSQLHDWSSIGFDFRKFDWLRRANSPFSLSRDQKLKCKPVNTESPESGKWKNINIKKATPRMRFFFFAIFHARDVRKNVLPKFKSFEWRRHVPCWCKPPTQTFVTRSCPTKWGRNTWRTSAFGRYVGVPLSEGHKLKYGRRKPTATSVFEFSYLCVSSSVEELINIKVM